MNYCKTTTKNIREPNIPTGSNTKFKPHSVLHTLYPQKNATYSVNAFFWDLKNLASMERMLNTNFLRSQKSHVKRENPYILTIYIYV